MIRVEQLYKRFQTDEGEVVAVHGVSFTVAEGAFYTLLGPSGCGKTTTLRCIAGLEMPDDGLIVLGDQTVFSRSTPVPANERDIGMVFQSYAIWPHMSVLQNVMFPLRYRKKLRRGRAVSAEPEDPRKMAMEALELVRLAHLADRPAPNLSGGQQQRVAVARAIVGRPRVLLMDEPLSNLDAKLREEMRLEIKKLTKELGITTLYVTHDQAEALAMSDQVAVMRDGRIVQSGPPREIYLNPVDRGVAAFMGRADFIPGKVLGTENGLCRVETRGGIVLGCKPDDRFTPGTRVEVMIRPEFISMGTGAAPADDPAWSRVDVTVREALFTGDRVECFLETPFGEIEASAPAEAVLEVGQRATVYLDGRKSIAFVRESSSEMRRSA